jgi:hypothetical protein
VPSENDGNIIGLLQSNVLAQQTRINPKSCLAVGIHYFIRFKYDGRPLAMNTHLGRERS